MSKAQASKVSSKKTITKKPAKKEEVWSKPLNTPGDLFFDEAVPAEDMQAAFGDEETKTEEEEVKTQPEAKPQEKPQAANLKILHTFLLSRPANDCKFDPVLVGGVLQEQETGKIIVLVRKIAFVFYFLSPLIHLDTSTGLHRNTVNGKQLNFILNKKDDLSPETGLPQDFEAHLADLLQDRSVVLDHGMISSRMRLKESSNSQKHEHAMKTLFEVAQA